MPSKSKAQQRFFGMVRATQKGKMKDPPKEVSDAAKSMSKSDVKDFAKTKHKGLPMKKKQQKKLSALNTARLLANVSLLKQAGKLPGPTEGPGTGPGDTGTGPGDTGTGPGDTGPGATNPATPSNPVGGANKAQTTVAGVVSRIRNLTPGAGTSKRRDTKRSD